MRLDEEREEAAPDRAGQPGLGPAVLAEIFRANGANKLRSIRENPLHEFVAHVQEPPGQPLRNVLCVFLCGENLGKAPEGIDSDLGIRFICGAIYPGSHRLGRRRIENGHDPLVLFPFTSQ